MLERNYEPLRFNDEKNCLDITRKILDDYYYKKLNFYEAMEAIKAYVTNEKVSVQQFAEFLYMAGYPVDL